MCRNHDYFVRENNEWLKKELSFDSEIISFLEQNKATDRESQSEDGESAGTSTRERPPVAEWDDLSNRSKRRKETPTINIVC